MHRTFSEIGREIAKGWGKDDGGNFKKLIKRTGAGDQTVCLLAAVVDQLRRVSRELSEQNMMSRSALFKKPAKTNDPVAEGMLYCLSVHSGDTPIRLDYMAANLSSRAITAIRRSKVSMLSEVTEERMIGVSGCGATTVEEVMRWKEGFLNAKPKETT